MLKRKMLRDIRANLAQFFSIMLLSMIAMWCYTGFQANVIGGSKARTDFENSSNFADGWIYGADFNSEQLRKVADVVGIRDVQLRTEVLGKADEKYNTAEMYCYFQSSAEVTVPYILEGCGYDPNDADGLWLFSKFAEAWDINIGDRFTVHVMGLDIEKEVKGLISRHPNITGLTMLREDYEAAGMTFRPVTLVSKENCEGAADKDCVSAVHSMTDLIAAFDKMMEIMNLLVYFMVVFSVMLIVIVLYNSGNLSFNEREKEFATLKVLGFRSSAIRRLLSTQNLWLSLIGCICGLPLGRVPLQAMMDSNGDAVDWPCYLSPKTYIIAAIFVMTVSVLVSFLFARRIKKIDMVGVLKGME